MIDETDVRRAHETEMTPDEKVRRYLVETNVRLEMFRSNNVRLEMFRSNTGPMVRASYTKGNGVTMSESVYLEPNVPMTNLALEAIENLEDELHDQGIFLID